MNPTPYYDKNGIVIYVGDCLKIVSSLDNKNFVVVTDPPYGISHPTNYNKRGRSKLARCRDYAPVHGDNKGFNPEPWIQYPCILWGANHYANLLPPVSGWLVWDKERPDSLDQSTCELAWSNFVKGVRRFRFLWHGCMRASKEELIHPTQKPTALMKWCIQLRWTPDGTIFDPFMGSGTTLVAAQELGRRAVGIELSEEYCKIAVERLRQPSFWSLPAKSEAQDTQRKLI